MVIQSLSSMDKDSILKLEIESAPEAPFYSRYSNDVKALDYIFDYPKKCEAFGIYENERLIAWGAYRTQWNTDNSQEEGIYEISSVVVDKLKRRQGIGKRVLNHMIEQIKINKDFKSIYLTVYPRNIPALIMYLQIGFFIYAYKKDVYGPGSDRLYLRLTT
jgi:ribosomal protein S18 acetylase RimI-like enzyme